MCEREEWPNHLQGNGVGTVHETPILGGDWLSQKQIDQQIIVLYNYETFSVGNQKKMLRPRGFSYISHIQKNVFKKRLMLFIKIPNG